MGILGLFCYDLAEKMSVKISKSRGDAKKVDHTVRKRYLQFQIEHKQRVL